MISLLKAKFKLVSLLFFFNRVSFNPAWPWIYYMLSMTLNSVSSCSQCVGITSVHHHAWLMVWVWVFMILGIQHKVSCVPGKSPVPLLVYMSIFPEACLPRGSQNASPWVSCSHVTRCCPGPALGIPTVSGNGDSSCTVVVEDWGREACFNFTGLILEATIGTPRGRLSPLHIPWLHFNQNHKWAYIPQNVSMRQ